MKNLNKLNRYGLVCGREVSVITRILQVITAEDSSAGELYRFHEFRRTEIGHSTIGTIIDCAAPASSLGCFKKHTSSSTNFPSLIQLAKHPHHACLLIYRGGKDAGNIVWMDITYL